MAIIARLVGEGIGPFRTFDFDFSDNAGNPHPGPHIFAGVNGSGKSTILKTLAWMFELPAASDGFPWQEWQHLTQGYGVSRAMVVIDLGGITKPFAWAQTTDIGDGWQDRLHEWMKQMLAVEKVKTIDLKGNQSISFSQVWPDLDPFEAALSVRTNFTTRPPVGYLRICGPKNLGWRQKVLAAAYGPSRTLKHIPEVDLRIQLSNSKENSLSFESTVKNDVIQSWLVSLLSREALAKVRGQSAPKYSAALERFVNALGRICGREVKFDVDIEPSLQPRLVMHGKRLDFSQLPDGVKSMAGWLADFIMRIDMSGFSSSDSLSQSWDHVLLLDEVDAHLHPKWQRSILPSIKHAFPEVQMFATSHSPFVIASCPGARVHVLELNDDGHAINRPPIDAPIGESILATIKDIFDVNSRFDVDTEGRLQEWNQLRRAQVTRELSASEQKKLNALVQELSSRGEELKQIVSPPLPISESLLTSLRAAAEPHLKRPMKEASARQPGKVRVRK